MHFYSLQLATSCPILFFAKPCFGGNWPRSQTANSLVILWCPVYLLLTRFILPTLLCTFLHYPALPCHVLPCHIIPCSTLSLVCSSGTRRVTANLAMLPDSLWCLTEYAACLNVLLGCLCCLTHCLHDSLCCLNHFVAWLTLLLDALYCLTDCAACLTVLLDCLCCLTHCLHDSLCCLNHFVAWLTLLLDALICLTDLAWVTLFSCVLVRRPALIRLRPYLGRSEAGGEGSMCFPISVFEILM